jgi:SAM-dependent methyltransferase
MPAHGSSGPADTAQPIDANAFIAFEAAGWERQAPTYGDVLGQITRQFVPALLDAAGVASGLHVLDLATGPGYAAGMAAQRGASVVGVDFAEAMVQLARRGHPDLDFRVADAEALPFPDGTFDVVVSNFVVPHLGRPERALAELARVLRPGGRLALTTWDQPARMRLLGTFLEAFGESGAMPPASLPVGPPFFRFADDVEFAGLLKGCGLSEVGVSTIDYTHRASTIDEIWDGLLTGTVRTSALVSSQPEAVRRDVRDAFERRLAAYWRGDHLELPIAVKLARGRRPV